MVDDDGVDDVPVAPRQDEPALRQKGKVAAVKKQGVKRAARPASNKKQQPSSKKIKDIEDNDHGKEDPEEDPKQGDQDDGDADAEEQAVGNQSEADDEMMTELDSPAVPSSKKSKPSSAAAREPGEEKRLAPASANKNLQSALQKQKYKLAVDACRNRTAQIKEEDQGEEEEVEEDNEDADQDAYENAEEYGNEGSEDSKASNSSDEECEGSTDSDAVSESKVRRATAQQQQTATKVIDSLSAEYAEIADHRRYEEVAYAKNKSEGGAALFEMKQLSARIASNAADSPLERLWGELAKASEIALGCDQRAIRERGHSLFQDIASVLIKRTRAQLEAGNASMLALPSICKMVSLIYKSARGTIAWEPIVPSIIESLRLLEAALPLLAARCLDSSVDGDLRKDAASSMSQIFETVEGPVRGLARSSETVVVVAMQNKKSIDNLITTLERLIAGISDDARRMVGVLGDDLPCTFLDYYETVHSGIQALQRILQANEYHRNHRSRTDEVGQVCQRSDIVRLLLQSGSLFGRPGLSCYKNDADVGVQIPCQVQYFRYESPELLRDPQVIVAMARLLADVCLRPSSAKMAADGTQQQQQQQQQHSELKAVDEFLWAKLAPELAKVSADVWKKVALNEAQQQELLRSVERTIKLYPALQKCPVIDYHDPSSPDDRIDIGALLLHKLQDIFSSLD